MPRLHRISADQAINCLMSYKHPALNSADRSDERIKAPYYIINKLAENFLPVGE
jgi:hypothetical protein